MADNGEETPTKPQDEKETPAGKASMDKTISSSSTGEKKEPKKVQENQEAAGQNKDVTAQNEDGAAAGIEDTDAKEGANKESEPNVADTPDVKVIDPSVQDQPPNAGPDQATEQKPTEPPFQPATYPPPQEPPPPHPSQYPPQQPPPTSTVVINTVPAGKLGTDPMQVTCPNCQQNVTTQLDYQKGCLTWLICGLLCLFGLFLGCCLIPFCVNSCKDVVHTCPNCKVVIGTHKRI
ncbi:uncharacterized protein LOC142356286 isoform X1 [Convolutriloba macropyga]|uniref:uncharacterized protein LOC142356286 isoform X1 n=1 Tax=Convolutriloba macropyga TaxID=536237 RepID=UPI003F51D4D7